jgi:hypothetical protein
MHGWGTIAANLAASSIQASAIRGKPAGNSRDTHDRSAKDFHRTDRGACPDSASAAWLVRRRPARGALSWIGKKQVDDPFLVDRDVGCRHGRAQPPHPTA